MLSALKKYFGFDRFLDNQQQIVDSIMQGNDLCVVMPTGAGKSLCYQLPALMKNGYTIIVSPLISLMKDQVNALTQNGVKAAYLNSSLTFGQYAMVISNIRRGAYKILYVAPERLSVADFLDACSGIKIDLLAIDEA